MGSSSRAPDWLILLIGLINVVFIIGEPHVKHVSIVTIHGRNVTLRLVGDELTPSIYFQTTASDSNCDDRNAIVPGSLFFDSPTTAYITIVNTSNQTLYLCLARTKHNQFLWKHQRIKVLSNEYNSDEPTHLVSTQTSHSEQDLQGHGVLFSNLHEQFRQRRAMDPMPSSEDIKIYGMRVETSGSEFGEDGIVVLLSQSLVNIRLFGENLTHRLRFTLTPVRNDGGSLCEFPSSEVFEVEDGSITNNSAVVEVIVPSEYKGHDLYFLCVKSGNSSSSKWIHQGDVPWLQIRVYAKFFPLWASIITLIFLLCCSALFSGLTLGLMSMDKTDLKILCNTGSELEKKYAAAIMPVRSHGSLLLCSLLLGNVLVNSVLTILMDDITSGVVAVIFSTLTIVIFGEIMPQAFCSRHGLAVGAKTIYITKFVILLTAVVAYPISKVLDFMLGEEIGNVYNRERLNELVKTGTDIEKDEVNIISGALQLSKKTVTSVMTKLDDVFMLSYDAVLDFETVSEIMNSGYSRIPIYDERRSNITSILYIKDLAFVDPDDNTPLKTLVEFYQCTCYFVFEDLTLDVLFKKFKEGSVGHMAFVQRVNVEGEGDPFYETVGLLTLEDIIEELIQAEIVDETDVWTDNRSKRKREKMAKNKNFAAFAEKRDNQHVHITPHMTLATFQYLSTSVEAFKAPGISETILRRLLRQNVYRQVKNKNKDKELIYQAGKPSDYFVLILEGRVEVLVGKENMRFESGPFTYFGVQALLVSGPAAESPVISPVGADNTEANRTPFVPDYTVRATTDLSYVLIKRSLYVAARRATLLGQSKKGFDHFDDEVDKILYLGEDDRSQSSRRTSQCDRESPANERSSFVGDFSPSNGILPTGKSGSEIGDPEERTTLLQSAVS